MPRCKGWPGYPDNEQGGPYTDDYDFTPGTIVNGKEFSDKQKALLMAYNLHKNGGTLKSDYYGLSTEILPEQYKETIEDIKVPTALELQVKQYYMELYEEEIDFPTADSSSEESAAVDHIVPKTQSGSNAFNNAAVISRKCNSTKGNTYIESLVNHYGTCDD